uniref:Large ribosomal subunit protein uL3c n=1 Tax=Caloglossa intermedia TaxID=100879 RepID=A0A1Z1M6G6_9FLOR|nr:ribosomal protein L3 [Caloglossa intermedia]ARW61492.1 ribosomal protein L3 [Caloglossa intermedia]
MPSINMLGKKVGMTQVFNQQGHAIPVTFLQVGPCTITKITNQNIQVGYEYINPKKLNKANVGHFNQTKLPCFKYLREYKAEPLTLSKARVGNIYTIEQFIAGKLVNVSGVSIGKGFCGYQKRHNFNRGPMSHGSKNHRQPGSIGAGTTPGRVFPGKKMAGHMGDNKTTIKNLKIIDINIEKNILTIKGSVPGKNGGIVYIYTK